MTTIVACLVCAPPLDGLLTSGLHAGVLAMALVVAGMLAAIAGVALRLLREDRAARTAVAPGAVQHVGQSFSSACRGGSKEPPYVELDADGRQGDAR